MEGQLRESSDEPRPEGTGECQRRGASEAKREHEEAEALRRERERLRMAEHAGRVGVFDWDLRSDEIFSTGELDKLLGLEPGGLGGRYEAWARLVHPEDLARVQREREEWLHSGRRENRWEYRLVRPDGQVRWLEARAEVVRDESGEPRRVVGAVVDITERRQMERELEESEERYRTLLEQAPDAVMVYQEGRLVYVNAAAVKYFGARSLEELLGREGLDLVRSEDHAMVKERARQVLENGGPVGRRETRLVRLDGQVMVGESAVAKVSWMGRPAVQVVVRDISERKQAEMKLRQSEARFRSYAESTQDVIWIANPAWQKLEYLSPAFERIWGRSREGVRPQDWLESIHDEDRPKVLQAMQQAEGGGLPHVEYRIVRPDGGVRWISDYGFTIRDEDGAVRCVAGIARDITEPKQAEQDLQRSQRLLQNIMDGSTNLIFVKDLQGRFLMVNRAFTQAVRMSPEELLGRTDYELFPRFWADYYAAHDRQVMEAGRPLALEELAPMADGTEHYFLSNKFPLIDGEGKSYGLCCIAIDIDERKRMEQALNQAKAGLARANQRLEQTVQTRTADLSRMVMELQQFSYAITHDMRAPLRAIHHYAALQKEQCARRGVALNPQFLDRMQAAVERMDSLITDSLDYARAIQQPLRLVPVDLELLVEDLIHSYPNLQTSAENIEIEGRLPTVLGTEAALVQCFSNLLDNAVKFVARGTRPHVRLWAEARAAFQRIWVEDNGIGIAPEYQRQIFQMFHRLDPDQYEGTGIGLAVVQKLVERMGGRVGVESEPGRGSRFWVEFRSANS